MNLAVCLKRVPDTTARIRIGAGGKSIDPAGIEYVLNPYDEMAIEVALRLKEKYGGETVGISVDGEGNEAALRKALAMGLDRGILVPSPGEIDGAATASMLAAILAEAKYDIILFGKQAVDDDSGQVPTLTAARLGLPRVNVCVGLELEGDPPSKAKCRRQIEGGEERLDLALPCVVAVQKGINGIHEPRYPSLKGIMAAKKKTIEKKAVPVPPAVQEILRMEMPPDRPPGKIVGEGTAAVPELVRLLREEAKVL